ncbi:cytochrome P450 [Xylaria sp. CBS 124048]|nr:cytochrome P450 [Xylaria sp. CBS 124048]
MDATLELIKSKPLFSLCALGVGVVLLLFISKSRDPLAPVPGPWYAKWTDLVSTYYWLAGGKPAYIHNLHRKYGPIVRVGPREVFVADLEAVRRLYAVKNEFPKSNWYRNFVPFIQNIFNTTDLQLHRQYRRLLSAPLSESGLKSFLPQIDSNVKLTLQRMKEEFETRGVTDIYKWWLFMATDVIGELSFGESFRMLETGKINQYISDLQSVGKIGSYRSAFPALFRLTAQFGVPLPGLKTAQDTGLRVRRYATESLQRHRDLVEKEGPNAQPTVLSKLYHAEGDESISPPEMVNNAQSYIVAGSDTTSNTLDYLVWAVCRDPEIKSRLNKELEALPEEFTYEELRHVPYLDHVIDETLRRYATVPSGLPRQVPAGGTEMCGHHIPASYTVTAQNHTLHADPHAFPDPHKFDPSRWENLTQAMKDAFRPFGGGSRICIGLHLARVELRLATARFFKAFPNAKVSTLEGMSDKDMIPEQYFLAAPRGHRCLVELY